MSDYAHTDIIASHPVDADGAVLSIETVFEPFGIRTEGKISVNTQ